jgi:cytidylate kinase
MNGRRVFREYAQSKGKEAKEFVEIIDEQYQYDTLITKDNDGIGETTSINYKDMVKWIIRTKPNGV